MKLFPWSTPLSATLSVSLLALVGCGNGANGAGGSGGQVTSTDGASSDGSTSDATSTASTSIASSSHASATSTSTGMGLPCTPLKDGVSPNPTPGECQGNVAVTCGQDGFLTQETCTGSSTCSTYDLTEQRFDGLAAKWVDGRTVGWAGCKPAGTTPCVMSWNGNTYEPTTQPHCEGANKFQCVRPPAPDLFSGSPQLQYWTKDGWLLDEACGATERCAGGNIGSLTCIPTSTPPCDGTEPFCSAQGIVQCYGQWESQPGYRVTEPCNVPGDVCHQGAQYPFCGSAAEVPCDEATFGPRHCEAGGGSVVECYNGFTSHSNCATCLDGQGQTVACHCDQVYSNSGSSWTPATGLVCSSSPSPSCVPQATVDCNPMVEPDTCNANVAHRCVGHWEDLDCAAKGLVCGVTNGLAGCKSATAAACAPGYHSHCDGTTMVACCGCGNGGFLFGPVPPPCVPGFEVRSDCAMMGGMYSCQAQPPPFSAVECKFM